MKISQAVGVGFLSKSSLFPIAVPAFGPPANIVTVMGAVGYLVKLSTLLSYFPSSPT